MFRSPVASIAGVLLVAALALTGGSASATDPSLPAPLGPHLTVAALGDSVTTAWGSTGVPGDNLAGSWATGTEPTVVSHVSRLNAMRASLGLAPATVVELAHSGSRIGSSNGIVAQAGAVPADADLVLIGNGSADLCASTVTSVADLVSGVDFEQATRQALQTIVTRAPGAKIFVASIPSWYGVWQRLPSEVRTPDTCPLLFSTDTTIANDASRAAVDAATVAYNAASKAACLAVPACRYDNGAVYDLVGETAPIDLRGLLSPVDKFHPSLSGQAAIAAAAWTDSWFAAPINAALPTIAPSGAPAQGAGLAAAPGSWTGAPTFAFDWRSCAGTVCQSVGSGATYTPGPSDAGRTLQIVVTATNESGTATASSAPTDAVAAAPPPVATTTTATTTTTTTTTTMVTTTTTTTPAPPPATTTEAVGASVGSAPSTPPDATPASAQPAPSPPPAQPAPAPSPPPRATLAVEIAGRLVAHRHGSVAVLAATLRTRNADTLFVSASSPPGPLTFLPRSALETAVTGRTRTRIVYRPRGGEVDVHALLRFASARLHPGVAYRLVVEAIGTSGEVSVSRFSFVAAG